MRVGLWRREKDVLAKDWVEGPRGVNEGRGKEQSRGNRLFLGTHAFIARGILTLQGGLNEGRICKCRSA